MKRYGRTDDIAFNICGTESASENTLKMTDQKEDDELGKFKIIFNEMQPDMSEFMMETVSGAMRSHLKGELKSYQNKGFLILKYAVMDYQKHEKC